MADPQPADEDAETAATEEGGAVTAGEPAADDYLDEQEDESFPASDPHSDWAGPPT